MLFYVEIFHDELFQNLWESWSNLEPSVVRVFGMF